MAKYKQLFWAALITLFLSGCSTAPYRSPAVTPQSGIYHIVGSGQNLYRISKAYGLDIKEIMRVNNIKIPGQLEVGERIFIPGASRVLYIEPYKSAGLEPIEKIVGRTQYKVHWRTITLHHSGTREGSAAIFDRNHRHRGMGGLFYHFVIGNGSSSGDGQIEVGWRWKKQVEANRKQDIQICLVGDFNKQEVTSAQFNSLVKLIAVLEQRYSIPGYNIRTHKHVPGRVTECPGSKFPFSRIKAELSRM